MTLFSSTAFALDPPPGGWYTDETTALGQDALLNYNAATSVGQNTALGFEALYQDTTGRKTLPLGTKPLHENTLGVSNVACRI